MAPQRRSARNRGLPRGLRERNGYYSWTHPDGREFGLGRDRTVAIKDAIEANLAIAGELQRVRLVDRLDGSSDRTLAAWAQRYEKVLAKRGLAENTARTYRSLLKRTRATFGDNALLERVDTLAVSDALDALQAEGKARTAQAWRSFLSDFFRAAVAAGWISANPVLVTEKVSVEVRRARLTLEVFLAARERAVDWLRNAANLALVSAQRREDVASARFADVREAAWWVEQSKTGQRLCLPLALRLDAVGLSLEDVVRQCRASGILSKHLVHQTRPWGNSPRGAPIWVDTVTRRWSDCIAALGIDWKDKAPPTFHEIRSLSERLYKAQGNVDTQELLGHKDPRSTRTYHDARGAEWVRVKVG